MSSATNSATETIRHGIDEVVNAGRSIENAIRELGQAMQAMQESARIVADSVAEQAERIHAIAEQAETSSSGVDVIARNAALVENLAGEAAILARQTDDSVKATSALTQELERSIGEFLGQVAQSRAEKHRAAIRQTG